MKSWLGNQLERKDREVKMALLRRELLAGALFCREQESACCRSWFLLELYIFCSHRISDREGDWSLLDPVNGFASSRDSL